MPSNLQPEQGTGFRQGFTGLDLDKIADAANSVRLEYKWPFRMDREKDGWVHELDDKDDEELKEEENDGWVRKLNHNLRPFACESNRNWPLLWGNCTTF